MRSKLRLCSCFIAISLCSNDKREQYFLINLYLVCVSPNKNPVSYWEKQCFTLWKHSFFLMKIYFPRMKLLFWIGRKTVSPGWNTKLSPILFPFSFFPNYRFLPFIKLCVFIVLGFVCKSFAEEKLADILLFGRVDKAFLALKAVISGPAEITDQLVFDLEGLLIR